VDFCNLTAHLETKHYFFNETFSKIKPMRYQLTRVLVRVEKPDSQSDYDYDAFTSCSLDSENDKAVKIYCFDRDKLAVVFYDNGDAEIVSTNDFSVFYKSDKEGGK
jgi:hypothetical protein